MRKVLESFALNSVVGIIIALVLIIQETFYGIENTTELVSMAFLGGASGSFLTEVVKVFAFKTDFSWVKAGIGAGIATIIGFAIGLWIV